MNTNTQDLTVLTSPEIPVRKNILLVEDDVETAGAYMELLSEQYTIMHADDGEDGWIKLKNGKYDVILLDLLMPRLDGIGFLTRKAADPAVKDIPVIILTNIGRDPILKKCFDLGARYCLVKAETAPPAILATISEVLTTD